MVVKVLSNLPNAKRVTTKSIHFEYNHLREYGQFIRLQSIVFN